MMTAEFTLSKRAVLRITGVVFFLNRFSFHIYCIRMSEFDCEADPCIWPEAIHIRFLLMRASVKQKMIMRPVEHCSL